MMLGDEDAGKTSLTIRYISGFFLNDLKLTIGVDFYSKTTNYNDKKVKLQIWDFGGEERFWFLLHQYCKGANAAFFLYNITIPRTLEHLPDWVQIIREHAGDIPIMLVGTNTHLKAERTITREQGIQAARNYNLSGYIEVSAKTGQNVEKLFNIITEILFDKYRPRGVIDFVNYPMYKCNKPIIYKSEKFKIKSDNKKDKSLETKSSLKKLTIWIVAKIKRILNRIKALVSRVL